jgi:hypothetical protein
MFPLINAIAENGDEAQGAPATYAHIRNNLMYSVPTARRFCPWLYGINNLMYGAGAPVTDLTRVRRVGL